MPPGRKGSADALEAVYAAAAITVCVAAWCALLLAELGLFLGIVGSIVSLVVGAGTAVVALRDLAWTGLQAARRELAAVALLVLLGAAVLGRPHEYILGGLDPGNYVNAAVLIAEQGSVAWHDPELPRLGEAARSALFREQPSALTEGSRLVGFYFGGLADGRVIPHGMHLFPSAMAVGYGLGGLRVALLVPAVLSLLGVAGAALLARRLAGPAAGGLAAVLLLLNPAESWFGRYPAAETMLQAALFGGLVALLLAHDRASWRIALVAGVLLGLVHLAKIETFVLPIAVACVLGWRALAGRFTRVDGACLLGYVAMLVHTLLHVSLFAGAYAVGVYARSLPSTRAIGAVAVAVLAALLAMLLRPGVVRWLRRELAAPARVRAICLLAVGALLLLGAYAWWVRPLDLWGEIAAVPEPFQPIVRNRLQTLPRLGWYLPSLALLLGGAGLALAAIRARGTAIPILLLAACLEAVVVVSDPRITPEYPWAARRWVGMVIPVAIVLAAAQVRWLAPRRTPLRALPRLVLPVGLACALVAASAGASLPLLRHQEYRGSAALIERIARDVRPNGVVLLDDDLVGWRLSTPLVFIGHRSAFVLFNHAAEDDRLAAALNEWEHAGRTVYWLRMREGPAYYQWGRYWRPDAYWKTELTEVASTIEAPPTGTRAFDVPIVLYEALSSES